MSLKREPSPGPLSGSKLSLGKLTSRQHPTGSISIRFSAAAMDDDLDDDLDLTIGTPKTQEEIPKNHDKSPKDRSPKESVTIELVKNDPLSLAEATIPASERSRSAPPSEVSTPVSPTAQGTGSSGNSTERVLTRAASDASCPQEEEQRSLLAGFRERFQDRIPEPLSQLIDKFSGENSPEEKERKIKKSESLDSARSTELFSADKNKKDIRSSLDKRKSHSRNASADSNASTADTLPPSASERLEKSSSFELVEDFYSQEPFEDFTGGSSIGLLGTRRSSSSDQISRSVSPHKPKSKLQRLIGSLDKGSPGHRSVSMTLSGLLSNREEELSEEEFFDPEEQQQNDSSTDNSSQQVDNKPSDKSLPKEENPASPSRLPFQKMLAATAVLFAYLIIPLPSFVNGLCIGAVTTLGMVLFYQWWRAPPKPREPFVLPPLDQLPPLRVPEMKESKNEDGKFKGWMNELYNYNPDDYHINQTHSVYVQLEGTNLRLQRSKQNVPKRAMWDEKPLPTPTFVHQRHFDLVGSNVSLVPPGLVKKRLWSKKYPICVALAKTGSKVEQKLKKEGSLENELAKGMGYEVIPEVCDDSVLFLFARTGREKEAWFRRLDAGSRGDPLPTRITDLILPLPSSAGATSTGTADHHHHQPTSTHPERSVSDYEVGTDVVSKLQKRHSTPNLIRQPTPPLATAPPTTTSTSTATSSSTTTTSTTSPAGGSSTASQPLGVVSTGPASTIRHRRQGSADSISSIHSEPLKDVTASSPLLPRPPPAPSELLLTEYVQYMGQVMPAGDWDDTPTTPTENNRGSRASSPTSPHPKTKEDKDKEKKQKKEKDKEGSSSGASVTTPRSSCELPVRWLNAVLGRCFFDFQRETYWAEKVHERIQRKLSKIHVPYMIDELTVTEIEMGQEMPFFRRISQPYLDDQGLWVDVDVAYNGGFQMSLETKVNLMKLKKTGSVSSDERSPSEKRYQVKQWHKSPVTDSEEEDSAESSTDEEGDDPAVDSQEDRAEGGKSTSRKLLRFVDKITQSKYFQQATEYKYIKRAMEEVSNTPLQLTVELRSLAGTLAVNIPPPPTDRIWYGFRTNPKLCLVAKPKVGTREVTVTHITDWIEKKLQIEFQRIFVMPNMDDLPVPLMSDNLNTNPTPPS